MSRAYYCTVKELNELGKENIPDQFKSNMHLIYSSPATLAFNSPGAEGFGVKRAGLAIPDSIMLIVAPGCCGRNTSLISSMREYDNRFFYLMMDETDIVTGRHLKKIPKAVEEILSGPAPKTGEESRILVFSVLLGMSVTVMGGTIYRIKMKKGANGTL